MDHVIVEAYVSVEWLRGSNVGIVRAVLIINRILKHEKILTRQELDACSTRLRHQRYGALYNIVRPIWREWLADSWLHKSAYDIRPRAVRVQAMCLGT